MVRGPTYEQLIVLVEELKARNAELERIVTAQAGEIVELHRRLAADSSNSSRPPSADAPWSKKPPRSSRIRSGRRPGKQPGAACTQYLTLLHVGGRGAKDIDAGGVLPAFTGVLMRDGYAGNTHLPALHAWCAGHLLRDLRSISDADPNGQLWATAMATTLTEANHTARQARERDAEQLTDTELRQIRNHYLGALARGDTDNTDHHTPLADQARTLITRFRRFEDMILRFTVDLSVPFTNNEAERAVRPVKIQQRTSGGAWRTLQGLTDFAIVQSYLDTATKWGQHKLDALHQLFTTGAWLPPALTPAE